MEVYKLKKVFIFLRLQLHTKRVKKGSQEREAISKKMNGISHCNLSFPTRDNISFYGPISVLSQKLILVKEGGEERKGKSGMKSIGIEKQFL